MHGSLVRLVLRRIEEMREESLTWLAQSKRKRKIDQGKWQEGQGIFEGEPVSRKRRDFSALADWVFLPLRDGWHNNVVGRTCHRTLSGYERGL